MRDPERDRSSDAGEVEEVEEVVLGQPQCDRHDLEDCEHRYGYREPLQTDARAKQRTRTVRSHVLG